MLKDLHWLPIKERIDFKILCMTFKCLNGLAPPYLKELLNPYVKPRVLRSSAFNYLNVPRTSTCLGENSFSVYAPQLWNGLSECCKNSPTLETFKKSLKTHLFRRAYNTV